MKLHEAPQLGETDYAKRMSSFTRNVALDQQGIVQGVASLQATLLQMERAYQQAFGNYRDIEQQISDSMGRLTQGLVDNSTPPPRHGRVRAV
jgi:hypothetical protein